MSEEPPNPLRVKRRLPFEDRATRPGGTARRAGVMIYAMIALLLAGVAFYMGWIIGHPLMSPYVIAPAVGAAWFGLRLFMTLAPRA